MFFRANIRKEYGSLPIQKNIFPSVIFCLGRASSGASLTVEAAFVLPIFLYLMTGILYFVNLMGSAGLWTSAIQDTTRKMAIYAYAVKDQSAQTKAMSGYVSSAYASGELKKSAGKTTEFSLIGSSFLNGDESIDLVVTYRVQSQVPLFSFGSPRIQQRGCVRAWTGRGFREYASEDKSEGRKTIYVTEHGSVYHQSKNCPHLKLSIRQVSKGAVEKLRNRYGAKYYACGCCKSGTGADVYITNTGNRYHADASCSGLKRTIRLMDSSMAENLPPCSKCAK